MLLGEEGAGRRFHPYLPKEIIEEEKRRRKTTRMCALISVHWTRKDNTEGRRTSDGVLFQTSENDGPCVALTPTQGVALSICQGGVVRQRKVLQLSISEQRYPVLLWHRWDQEVAAGWPRSLAEGAPWWGAKWGWSKACRAKFSSPRSKSQNWLPSTELLLGGAGFPGVFLFCCCVTNDHKLSSLTQYTCFISLFLWSKV